MAHIKKSGSVVINQPLEKVWHELNQNFTGVSNWAGGVPNPKTPKGLNGSAHGGRVCQVGVIGKNVEVFCLQSW